MNRSNLTRKDREKFGAQDTTRAANRMIDTLQTYYPHMTDRQHSIALMAASGHLLGNIDTTEDRNEALMFGRQVQAQEVHETANARRWAKAQKPGQKPGKGK